MIRRTRKIPNELYGACLRRLSAYRSEYIQHCERRDEKSRGVIQLFAIMGSQSLHSESEAAVDTVINAAMDTVDAYQLDGYTEAYAMLIDNLRSLKGKRILHLASNLGIFLEFLQRQEGMVVVGIDTNREAVAFGKKYGGLDLRVADATDLPKSLGKFDAIVAHNFLDVNYLTGSSSLVRILNQSYSVLRKNGILVASPANLPLYSKFSPFARMAEYIVQGVMAMHPNEHFVLYKSPK